MNQILPLFIQYMPYLFQAAQDVPKILDYVQRMKDTFQHNDEWTQEAEDNFTAELELLKSNPPKAWKQDAQ